jgi:hypothetical protein
MGGAGLEPATPLLVRRDRAATGCTPRSPAAGSVNLLRDVARVETTALNTAEVRWKGAASAGGCGFYRKGSRHRTRPQVGR